LGCEQGNREFEREQLIVFAAMNVRLSRVHTGVARSVQDSNRLLRVESSRVACTVQRNVGSLDPTGGEALASCCALGVRIHGDCLQQRVDLGVVLDLRVAAQQQRDVVL
jgi:hypothetical protein